MFIVAAILITLVLGVCLGFQMDTIRQLLNKTRNPRDKLPHDSPGRDKGAAQ